MTDTPALTAEQRAAKAISALFIAQLETRDWLIASIASAIREAEQTNRIKAECYDACESVARNRLAHIPPDLEAEIPRLCGIEPRIWEQHRDRMPINAIDMLEHAKRKRLEERIAALEAEMTWQPIGAAPKDSGRRLLVWVAYDEVGAKNAGEPGREEVARWSDGGEGWLLDHGACVEGHNITHWRALGPRPGAEP